MMLSGTCLTMRVTSEDYVIRTWTRTKDHGNRNTHVGVKLIMSAGDCVKVC
jgi:hypothetical protein